MYARYYFCVFFCSFSGVVYIFNASSCKIKKNEQTNNEM